MNLQKAVVITTDSSLCEVEMDGNFDAAKLIGCQGISALVPGYFELFTGPRCKGYRIENGIDLEYDSEMAMMINDNALSEETKVNKICSDLYSACRRRPWPILGTGIIVHCDLKRLEIMCRHLPAYLTAEPRISDTDKEIILASDASRYGLVLKNLRNYV